MYENSRFIMHSDIMKKYKIEKGVICGINIKKIYNPLNVGLFIHVKTANDDQYDLIWKLYNRVEMGCNGTMRAVDIKQISANNVTAIYSEKDGRVSQKNIRKSLKKGISKHDVLTAEFKESPLLFEIFNTCGVEEWVQIIGSIVDLSIIPITSEREYWERPLIFMQAIANPTQIIAPDYFDIQTRDQDFLKRVGLLYQSR